MKINSKNYISIEFGEFFNQYYSPSLQKIAKTTDTIKFSIAHTYMINNKKMVDIYFHLNKIYKVIGTNTLSEITKLVTDNLNSNPKMDSVLNSLQNETN